MANLFNNPRGARTGSFFEQRGFETARSSLLLVAILTVVNIVLTVSGSFTYFLFSASIPYIITDLSMYFCGMYPEEFYEGGYAAYDFLDGSIFVVAMIISVAFIAFYLISYFLSKNPKHSMGWLIASLVIFSIDTVIMFVYYGLALDMIVDYLIHGYVIFTLIVGVRYAHKNATVPAYASPEQASGGSDGFRAGESEGTESEEPQNSTPMRIADMSVKARIFLEENVNGHNVIYRRVGKTNELVIDGRVYDEYTAIIEHEHVLSAMIDGHEICAGMLANSRSFIALDGDMVKQKLRLI